MPQEWVRTPCPPYPAAPSAESGYWAPRELLQTLQVAPWFGDTPVTACPSKAGGWVADMSHQVSAQHPHPKTPPGRALRMDRRDQNGANSVGFGASSCVCSTSLPPGAAVSSSSSPSLRQVVICKYLKTQLKLPVCGAAPAAAALGGRGGG